MKKLLMVLGTAVVLASCGGEVETSEQGTENNEAAAEESAESTPTADYFVNVGSESFTGRDCQFGGDGISGTANFTVGDQKIILLNCWTVVKAEGVMALAGKEFPMMVEGGTDTLTASITNVSEGVAQGSIGMNHDIEGTFSGSQSGDFKVSAFVMN